MSTRRIRRALVALGLVVLAMGALRVYGGWRRAVVDPARPLVALPPTVDLPALGSEGARLDIPIERFYDSLPWRARGAGCAWLSARTGAAFAERLRGELLPIEHCLVERYSNGELRVRDGAWRHGAAEPRLRVQAYGGSVVGGYPDAERGTTLSWPSLLAARLARAPGSLAAEVASFALGGASSGPQLWMLEHIGLAEGPDVVILQLGENDLGKCTTFPGEAERALERVLVGAEVATLERLHPWFARLGPRIDAERARLADERAASERWLVEALLRPDGVRDRDPMLHGAVLDMRSLPWVSEALVRTPPAAPVNDPRWPALVERAEVLRRWSAVQRSKQAELADPVHGGAEVDAERVAGSVAASVPVELVRRADFVRNVERMLSLAAEGGAARVVVLPVIEHRAHRGGIVDCPWTLFDQSDWMAYFDGPLREALRDLAEEHGAAVVDLPALLAERGDAPELFVDTVHMTREGLELFVDALEPALRAPLEGRGGLTEHIGGSI